MKGLCTVTHSLHFSFKKSFNMKRLYAGAIPFTFPLHCFLNEGLGPGAHALHFSLLKCFQIENILYWSPLPLFFF